MPNQINSFTSVYPVISHVLINDVKITEAFNPTQSATKDFFSKYKTYKAIWDTGATGTVITQKVIQECHLQPIGIVEVHGISGTVRVNQYLINVGLPNNVIVTNIKAVVAELEGVDVLIGMDIISRGDFAVTNFNGKTVFSYRQPSVERIDFVKKRFKPKPSSTFPKKRKR